MMKSVAKNENVIPGFIPGTHSHFSLPRPPMGPGNKCRGDIFFYAGDEGTPFPLGMRAL